MLSDRLDAQAANDIGLCTMVVPPNDLLSEARSLAERLVQGPAFALGLIKGELQQNGQGDLRAALERELKL